MEGGMQLPRPIGFEHTDLSKLPHDLRTRVTEFWNERAIFLFSKFESWTGVPLLTTAHHKPCYIVIELSIDIRPSTLKFLTSNLISAASFARSCNPLAFCVDYSSDGANQADCEEIDGR